MKKTVIGKFPNALAVLVIGAVLAFTIIRLFYGAELTDEAYSAAETYMVSEGALPFVDNWSQMPGFTLLLAPFVKVFTVVSGGTDGIFLFFRFLAFGINAITALAVTLLLRKYIKNTIILLLCSLTYVSASGWDYAVAFRGDHLAIDLLAVGAVVLAAEFTQEKENVWRLFISGVLVSLSVMCYPTLAVVYLYFILAIVFLCVTKKTDLKNIVFFGAGSLAAAIAVVGYLALNSGITDILTGIKYLLKDVTYFQLQNEGFSKVPGYFSEMVRRLFHLLTISGGCFIILFAAVSIFYRKTIFAADSGDCVLKKWIGRILLVSLIVGICVYHLYQVSRIKAVSNTDITVYAMTIETIAVPLVWPFIKKEKKLSKYMMGFIWFPTYVWVVITGIGTYTNMMRRHDLLKSAVYLLGIFVFLAVKDCLFAEKPEEKELIKKKNVIVLYNIFGHLLPVILIAVIMFSYLFNAYTHVYRDEPILMLDTVVAEGPYKGMRTTEERAECLIKLDRILDEYIDGDDYVLFMDNAPFLYLMSEGRICAPSTWDMTLFSYGFDQPDIYYDYFAVTGTEPSKIVYFNYGYAEIMSIDVEYGFNDYVRDHYNLIHENRNVFEWSYLDADVKCEMLVFERK